MWESCLKHKTCLWFSLLRPWQTRTHCCGHIVGDTNVSPFARARNICCGHKFCDTKNVSDFAQKHFVFATNVSQFAQPKKHHGQQCVLVYQGLNLNVRTHMFIKLQWLHISILWIQVAMENFLFKKAVNPPITSNLRIYTARVFYNIHVIFMLHDLWVSLHEI